MMIKTLFYAMTLLGVLSAGVYGCQRTQTTQEKISNFSTVGDVKNIEPGDVESIVPGNAESNAPGNVENSASGELESLTHKHWKLVELNGNPVNATESAVAAFLLMKPDGTVSGNLGCNVFTGSFRVQEGNRIAFSQLVNTQKMCMDMSIETEMVRVLQNADNYNLSENQLVLNRARMAPLARFRLVPAN